MNLRIKPLRTLLSSGFMIFSVSLIFSPTYVLADDLTEWSAPATGADMSTGIMGRFGLYAPHEDNCDVSEVFVPVATDKYGVVLGFCLEEDERLTALGWTGARDECLADRKRLPEPGEFVHACLTATGLNDMTDDWEWASNFTSNAVIEPALPRQGIGVPALGNGSCTISVTGWVATDDDAPSTLAFRCAR